MVMLADLLDDNATMHVVYRSIAAPDDRPGNLRRAPAHIRSLLDRTAHQETRDACQWPLAAFASLELVPANQSAALLTAELQRGTAAMNAPATPVRERNILRLRRQLLQQRLAAMEQANDAQIPRIVHLIKTDPRTDDLPLLQYLCYRSILAHCERYRIILHTAECLPDGVPMDHLVDGTGIHLFCSHPNFVQWAQHVTERDIAHPRSNLAKLMRPNL